MITTTTTPTTTPTSPSTHSSPSTRKIVDVGPDVRASVDASGLGPAYYFAGEVMHAARALLASEKRAGPRLASGPRPIAPSIAGVPASERVMLGHDGQVNPDPDPFARGRSVGVTLAGLREILAGPCPALLARLESLA